MIIAVNTRYNVEHYQPHFSRFICEYFTAIAQENPRHSFIFFVTEENQEWDLQKNTTSIIVPSKPRAAVLSGVLYAAKIKALLKKYHADVFVNAEIIRPFFITIPHFFILPHPQYFLEKNFTRDNNLSGAKKIIPSILQKATRVVTDSDFSKNFIETKYQISKNNIHILEPAINKDEFVIGWEEKENIKSQYAEGNEYFIFYGEFSQKNILDLLKAFSQFKKWQKSSMHLLIIKNNDKSFDLSEMLRMYKYRNDVKLVEDIKEENRLKIIASSYALLYSPGSEPFASLHLQALPQVPMIVDKNNSAEEIFANAAVYATFSVPADLSEKMILLFKDENLRKEMIEKGKAEIKILFGTNNNASLWNSILQSKE